MSDVIGAIVGFVLLVVVVAVVMAFPVMWCWNYVMPDLFGLAELDFWHSLVLAMLSGMLFKSSSSSSND